MEKNLGHNIRKIRELRGYKQEYMAKELGIDKSTYSDVESGQTEVSKDRLKRIAELLDTTPKAIEEFDERAIINIVNHQGSNVSHQVNGSQISIHNTSFEEFAKVLIEPYKLQLVEKERELAKKDKQLMEKEKRIQNLEDRLRNYGGNDNASS